MQDLYPRKSVLCGAIMGAILFVLIYGVNVLNPTYTEWLYTLGDLTKHQLAWEGFRFSAWKFPIGLTDSLYYPHDTCIIFHDIIPGFAILFKLLSPILPDSFQYWGLWGILCFILNGAISAKILQKYFKSDFQIILGSCFFILSFQVIQRMFEHTALAAHWIILLPIMVWEYEDESWKSIKAKIYMAVFIGMLTILIHTYFLLMCGIVLFGIALLDLWNTKNIWNFLLFLGSYIASAAITIYLLGGFSGNTLASSSGLGYFSFNLNSFWNSMGIGRILKALPVNDGQYEGFAYLGFGILALLIITTVNRLTAEIKGEKVKLNKKGICIIFINLIAIIIALSPVITFGQKTLLEFPVPPLIYDLWAVFRSTGRVAWIPVYFLFLYALCGDTKFCSQKIKIAILAGCFLIQLWDLSAFMQYTHQRFAPIHTYSAELTGKIWKDLSDSGNVKHTVYVSGNTFDEMRSVAIWALRNQSTLNKFSSARTLNIDTNVESKEFLATPQADTVYVGKYSDINFFINSKLNYYCADDYLIGTSAELSDSYLSEVPLILFDYNFYSLEQNQQGDRWRWGKNNAVIKIYSGSSSPKEMTLFFNIATGYDEPANVILDTGKDVFTLETSYSGNYFEKTLLIPPEGLSIMLTTDAPKATPVPTDTRTLYMRVLNWGLK